MKYSNYLQNGRSVVQTLIEKIMQSQGEDQSALQQLIKLAEEGNEEAIAFFKEVQGLQQQAQSMKCGGRVKKKALGSKITPKKVIAKGGCTCMIKKVGGRLIEVDSCTGLPMHRKGASIMKFQTPASAIQYNDDASGTQMMYDGATNKFYYWSSPSGLKEVTLNDLSLIYQYDNRALKEFLGKLYDAGYYKVGKNSLLKRTTDGAKYIPLNEGSMDTLPSGHIQLDPREMGIEGISWDVNHGYTLFIPPGGEGASWWTTGTKIASFNDVYKLASTHGNVKLLEWLKYHNNIGYHGEEVPYKGTIATWDHNTQKYHATIKKQTKPTKQEESAKKPEQEQSSFGAGKTGKYGGKTYDEALAMQREMLNADWFDADLGNTGITGRGDDGRWGNKSQAEWERYQQAIKARNEAKAAEITKAQNTNITRNTSDNMTNQALLNMDAATAMSTLSRPDWDRWQKLNSYKLSRDASLMYNGTRYADESAYNAAVTAEKARTAPQMDMDTILNTAGKQKRKDMYAQKQALLAKHESMYPMYAGPAALTQEQLNSATFALKHGGKLSYSQYLN